MGPSSVVRRVYSSAFSVRLPEIVNEPLRHFKPGSEERTQVETAVLRMAKAVHRVPCVVGQQEIQSDEQGRQMIPSDHANALCSYNMASKETVAAAIKDALRARPKWERMPFQERAAIFLRAADLVASKHGPDIMAATMLGQGKSLWQAEIDAHAELVDFLRFNCKYAEAITGGSFPVASPAGVWNRMEWRGLEGFVAAISPFNFTAIGGNLAVAPAIMGNVVLWKPSSSAVYSNYLVHQALLEAGLPPGVIQFLPGHPGEFVDTVLRSRDFAGLHFTGSTAVFQDLWLHIAKKVPRLKDYPRIVGETGGKNFHFVHASASVETVVHQTIRGAFEYQGQKCSACSRMYVPASLWPQIKPRLQEEVAKITPAGYQGKDGPVVGVVPCGASLDFSAFLGPVINEAAFNKITGHIAAAKAAAPSVAQVIAGGLSDKSKGYFVHPTVIEAKDPAFPTMTEEIFGPVLTVHVYPDDDFERTLRLVDKSSAYGLTGSFFGSDREAIIKASAILQHAAGNFYLNDKCTGAVVGQQPFGGGRKSGTNDKAGSALNLLRWTSPRSIKESFGEISTWRYPSNQKGENSL